jgi:hypothetical protein
VTVTKLQAGNWIDQGWHHLGQAISIAPLVTFRILFGGMMLAGIVRFWLNGWITELYVKPAFYFKYPGFGWVHPLGATGMHLLFGLMALSALFIAIGLFYRLATWSFFLIFTYVELIDVTHYLNHYYFISLVSFLLIWLPANRHYALDARHHPDIRQTRVPRWQVGILRLQVGILYFFAGLAKLNSDWLLEALPMKIWLPAKTHLPLVGDLLYESWVAYLFSWFGAFYDLFIVFFLLYRRTRPVAYVFVLGFHLATALFFPGIGLFPYVMILCSLIFLSPSFHERLLLLLPGYASTKHTARTADFTPRKPAIPPYWRLGMGLFFLTQLFLPLRYLLYPGHLFWHEEGFRFSWRVMLMEKSGNAFFYVKEPATGKTFEVNNREFLTPLQEKMMSTQPDMLLQYAHYLSDTYASRGVQRPEVYAECYVALNGRHSRLFVDTTINLAAQPLSLKHYTWVLPWTPSPR